MKCPYVKLPYECDEDCNECPVPHEFREDQKEGWCGAKSKEELDEIESKILRKKVSE